MRRSGRNPAGADKKKSSQQSIASFFNKGSTSQLFSTIGSANKGDKKILNLSTKKRNWIPKEQTLSDALDEDNKTEENLTLDLDVLDSLSCLGNEDKTKSNPKAQHLNEMPNPSNNVSDNNSDDDLIPPTPSPVGVGRSFMKSSSFSEKRDTHKMPAFTNLKLRQVILQKEEQERKKRILKMRSLGSCNDGSFSKTNASFSEKGCGTLDESSSAGNKSKQLESNRNNISCENYKNVFDKYRPETCDDFNMEDTRSLKTGNKTTSSGNVSTQKYTPEGSVENTQFKKSMALIIENGSYIPSSFSKEKSNLSLTTSDDSSRPLLAPSKIVLRKGKSSKRPASKGISPKNKRHHQEPPFHLKGNDVDESNDIDMAGMYGVDMLLAEDMDRTKDIDDDHASMFNIDSNYNLRLKNAENKRKIQGGIEEIEFAEHHNYLEVITEKSGIPFTTGKKNIREYDRHFNTPISPEKIPNTELDSHLTENKQLSVIPTTPGKTPIKDYDRQLITDMSLVTPTKFSPNSSRDSLAGVELNGLMDGLEWSPMPKNSTRMKLFEEYTPYSTPYCRFLVLEVYRRESNREESLSKYSRILSEKVLRLFDEGHSVERYCYLRQDWEMTEIEPGDIVHLTGDFDAKSGVCILDNQTDQYIVVHPDTLVSGTTVAGATRCLRRTILNERFRTEDTNEAMLIGTLLHDLFDRAMQENEFSKEKLVLMAKDLLQQHSYLNSLYILDMSEVTALDKINECIPVFSEWSKRYVMPFPHPDISLMDYKSACDSTDSTEQPSVCISALKDIEENIWSPRFGLKGKVDATVEVKIDRRLRIRRHKPDKENSVQTAVIPLELKTGKLFSKLGSVDHRAQAILYTLLLSDRHRHPVDSSLLYYMKPGHMVGVPALMHEKRALIMRRNEVARYLSLSRTTGGLKMPGMLKDIHTCSRCSQAQNCSLFHKSIENGNSLTSGLGELFDRLTQHMSPDHAQYFADWFKLVCLEGKEILQSGKSSQHHIWSMDGLEREALGQCLSGMVQTSRDDQPELERSGVYIHSFARSPDHPIQTPLVDVSFSAGDRVVVSEERSNAVAIASGYIREVKARKLKVTLDRDLSKCYRSADIRDLEPVYRLDKDEGYNSLVTPWSNVAKLLNKDSKRNADLRRLIIDLKPPVFARSRQALLNSCSQSSVGSLSTGSQASTSSSQTPSDTPKYRDTVVDTLMQDLNKDQKRAVAKVLCAEDYTLILGMPGTGKTTTIARLVQILVARGKTVLLTSYTHTAVDNILLKIKQAGLDFLRLGQAHKLLPEIQPYSAETGATDIKTVNELRDFYASKAVVATTCLGVNHALFTQRSFDYCIVDEASQITQPVCLGPLRHADVFVLVGDHYQLPPLVQSLEAREKGMDVSLFKRLSEHHPQAVVSLEHQYRMNKDIMALSNTLIYEEHLKCGTPQVANALLNIPQWNDLVSWFSSRTKNTTDNWLIRAVDPSHAVVFLNTEQVPAYENRNGHLVSNETEAILIQQLTCALRLGGVASSSIGIISPYRQQLKLIKELLLHQDSSEDLEINTVDKYQGRDKPCILVSLVRSNDTSSVGDLLKDWRRVNVAVTRAKSKLILAGSLSTLRASLLLRELIDLLGRNGWIHELPKNAHKMFVDLVQTFEKTDSQNSKINYVQLIS